MTPASVFSRFPAVRRAWLPATAALLLSAAGLRAQAGSRDPSFTAVAFGSSTYAVNYQAYPDGTFVKITVGGDRAYGQYLLDSGTAYSDFFFAAFGNAARIIYTIVPERHVFTADDLLPSLLFGGQFDGGFGRGTNNNKAAQNIIRIRPSGAIDTDFSTAVGTGANNFVTSILPLDDGRIVVGGLFTAFNKQPRRRIARLLNTGTLDANFATGANIDNDVLALAESIDQVTGMPDGSTLVAGTFNHVAGQPYAKLVRLDANGNLDMSFHPSIDLRVNAILVQSDGRIVIGGGFTNVNGTPVAHLARLKYDGSLDTSFVGGVSGVPNNDVNPTAVNVLVPLTGGGFYVGGEFARINGTPRQYIGFVNDDGVLDTGFDPQTYVYDAVQSIAIQSDYNILVGQANGPRIGNKYQPSLVRLFGVVPTAFSAAKSAQRSTQPQVAAAPAASASGTAATAAGRYIW